MTTPTFGPPIPCEGKRPAWLDDQSMIQWSPAWEAPWYTLRAREVQNWPKTIAIKLPADHWAYEPISRGFEPWAGAEEAPEDWGGGEVLLRGGEIVSGRLVTSWYSDAASNASNDILGYRKRLAKPASPAEESGEADGDDVERAKDELRQLIDAIWRAEFFREAPQWKPLPDLCGMISQMDNMYAGVRGQRDKFRWELNELRNHPQPNTVTLERMSVEGWLAVTENEMFPDKNYSDLVNAAHRAGAMRALRHLDLIAPPDDEDDDLDRPLEHKLEVSRSFQGSVMVRQMTEDEARELAGYDTDAIVQCLREWGFVTPPETSLDRWCSERGVTDETKAIIREAMEAVK